MFARLKFLLVSTIIVPGSLIVASQAAERSEPIGTMPATSLYSAAETAKVSDWIRERVPECLPREVAAAAQLFLEELKAQQPEKFEMLLGPEFPLHEFESELLRKVATTLTGTNQAAIRETLAVRRVQVLLTEGSIVPAATVQDAHRAIDKMKSISPVYYRRLVDGRFDDADLLPLLKRAGRAEEAAGAGKSIGPKILSAADIVSEFSRRNQVGSSLQRLRAYTMEAMVTTMTGEKQHLVLSRLRPNRFRLAVKAEETTQLILASNGRDFWEQTANRNSTGLPRAIVGSKGYLREFINPLFGEEGCTFEKIEDGILDGNKVYCVRVHRPDGSAYISRIDTDKFREVGRVNDDAVTVGYGDFREIAGVTFAFRETMKDEKGRTGSCEIQRIVPNPGLIQSYFEASDPVDPNYFAIEQWMGNAGDTAGVGR